MTNTAHANMRIVTIVAGALTTYATPSYAYLDPGTGSIILQSVLAGIAVAAGFLRVYWHRFKSFFSSLAGGANAHETEGDETAVDDVDIGDQS